MSLQQSTRQFVERINHVLENLHNAIEDRDIDEQHSLLAALVGLVEMLRSEIEHGDEEEPRSADCVRRSAAESERSGDE